MQIPYNKRQAKQKIQFLPTIVDSENDLIQMRYVHPSHRQNPIRQGSQSIEECKHFP
jgi:hypothetical protein